MKFGPLAPKDARGATAVHSIRQGDLVLKKGTLIGDKEIAALEAETKAKLEKILTPEQMQQLKNMRPPMRPGGAGNGQMRGGPGGHDDGNGAPSGPPQENN